MKKTKRSSKSKPEHWEDVLDKIKKMRKDKTAPVDTKSPGMLPDPKEKKDIANYQILIALMLSPQTRDESTALAIDKLKSHGLTPEKISEMSESDLAELIKNVSFYNTKAKHIKKATEILLEEHKGQVPNNLKDLLALPGVGKKIAYLALQLCFDKIEGIAVDTHIHRISNRLGWVKSRKPEDTQKQLEKWLPKDLWDKVNKLLVGFGQEICKSVKPGCKDCLAQKLCPYGKAVMKKDKARKRRHKEIDKD